MEAETGAEQDPELWDLGEDEAEEMGDFEAHAPCGPLVEAPVTRARRAATERTPFTPPPKQTGTAAPAPVEQGGAQPSQAQKVVSASSAESQRHGSFGAVATCTCDHPSIGKFLRFCIASLYIVAWICSSAHIGRD